MENFSPYRKSVIADLRKDREFALLYLKRSVEELNNPEDRNVSLRGIQNIIIAYGDLREIGREAGISQDALDKASTALRESKREEEGEHAEQQLSFHQSIMENLKKAFVQLGGAAAALHSPDPSRRAYGLETLGKVIQTYGGPDEIAQNAGISREELDAVLSTGGNQIPSVLGAALTAIGACLPSNSMERVVGEVRFFGTYGPKYQVERTLRQLDDGDALVEIAFIESGETTEYRLSGVLEDPLAD